MVFGLRGRDKGRPVEGTVSAAGEPLPLRRACRSNKVSWSLFHRLSAAEGCSIVETVLYVTNINKTGSFLKSRKKKLYIDRSSDIFWTRTWAKFHKEVLEKVRLTADWEAEAGETMRSICLRAGA